MNPRVWIAALALVASHCASSPRVESLDLEHWIELRTPLFSIVTHVSREEALHQANQLIAFTEVLREQLQAGELHPSLPLRIYIFAGWKQYGNFAPRGAVGLTLPRLQGSLLELSLQQPAASKAILFHEYVHYVLRNEQRVAYPPWYDEGLAEFLGATLIRGDMALVGALPLRFETLSGGRAMALETLLSKDYHEMDDADEVSDFYATAWLLVNYVHLSGHVGGPERLRPTLEYLARLNRGMGWREAFAASYPVSLDKLEREVDAYLERLERGTVVFSLKLDDPRPEIEERALSRVEAATLLAELGISVGNTGLGAALAREALRGAPAHPRALALAAEAAMAMGDLAGAARDAERALALAPDAPWAYETRAAVWSALAKREPGSAPAHLEKARESLRQATDLAPNLPSGWAGLGETYLEAEDCKDLREGIAALDRAYALAPWDADINLFLGQIHTRAGHREQALQRLQFVSTLSHHPKQLERAEKILEELESSSRPPC